MEDKEVHPLVELLLARMKSHPEEFKKGNRYDRWWAALDALQRYGSDADSAAIDAALRPIMLDDAHSEALDELLNGDERRRRQLDAQDNAASQIYAAKSQMISGQYAPGGSSSSPLQSYQSYQNALANVQTQSNIAAPDPTLWERITKGVIK